MYLCALIIPYMIPKRTHRALNPVSSPLSLSMERFASLIHLIRKIVVIITNKITNNKQTN